ncbi:hypothetical protein LEN26_017390 [Aphanomyces euteiches]|nr:hypothetical protein LEN26_017390 [Aphanomyces euteiches]
MSDLEENGRIDLDDQSMDEAYDMEDDLDASIDTMASSSPVKPSREDDDIIPFRRKDMPPAITYDEKEESSDDEPPEIPGSPIKPAKIASPTVHSIAADDATEDSGDAARDSSSSSSDDEYENDKQSHKDRIKLKSQAKTKANSHPPPKPAPEVKITDEGPPRQQPTLRSSRQPSRETESTETIQDHTRTLPPDIERLFQYIEDFKPEVVELPIYIQPFIPDYLPSIGMPYEGTHVLRPDNMEDPIGVNVLAEPGGIQSNVAELQLMLKYDYKPLHAKWEIPVLSIENAEKNPTSIDAWIASVAKIHEAQPLCHVHYAKPMPEIDSLLEIWPEELEVFLNEINVSAQIDLSLVDYCRLICAILDIPVYGNHMCESVHLLFTLYLACEPNPS